MILNKRGGAKLKKVLLVFALVLLIISLTSCGNGSKSKNHDFRYGNWGDDRNTIKKLDDELDWLTGNEAWEDDILMGDTILCDYDAGFSYHMENNRLVQGLYQVQPKESTATEYIKAYGILKKDLANAYGEPAEDKITPIVDTLTDSPQNPSALEHGYVVYDTIFETQTSDIMLAMYKNVSDDSFTLNILFTSNTDYYDGKN